ncbi:hypothetical protein ACUOFC_04985, partial [Escherichia sp. TWPC-MK]
GRRFRREYVDCRPRQMFANRGADVALIGTPDGVKTIVK